jgi:hypothetical protein
MDALQKVIRKIQGHSDENSAAALTALVESLDRGAPFDLQRLYRLGYKDFELALELIRHWRLDSYRYERGWASRIAGHRTPAATETVHAEAMSLG